MPKEIELARCPLGNGAELVSTLTVGGGVGQNLTFFLEYNEDPTAYVPAQTLRRRAYIKDERAELLLKMADLCARRMDSTKASEELQTFMALYGQSTRQDPTS